jgi:hypothetical protein
MITQYLVQYLVAGTMMFAIASIIRRTRDDDPVERACAVAGTIVICGVIAWVLYVGGFWHGR